MEIQRVLSDKGRAPLKTCLQDGSTSTLADNIEGVMSGNFIVLARMKNR
ncbi:hypothetical protein Q31b_28410 [Novipirellula aureliae]|uniref:Uncharacterized protein n=1 Tax=Novipirellula aureliae TaxID=2527966 RepID=A0A5C6E049_9BACT|nr:hypothetical protein Q31b_28410 [Novipirellula aureliae]